MKKQYFLTIDTETTITDKVVDFAAVVTDRKGNIIAQCAIIVAGIYKVDELFYLKDEKPEAFWSKEYLPKKYDMYDDMLQNGLRMMAKPEAINRWLQKVKEQYNPTLTAYNLAFDVDKMRNTGIDCDMFESKFCLWNSAKYWIATTKKYKAFCLANHYFTNRTDYGNMTIKTNAEVMTHFVNGNDIPEPHTALEDILDYEIPILNHLLRTKSTRKVMNYESVGWKALQVKNHYKA